MDNDNAACVFSGFCYSKAFVYHGLMGKGDVAVFVSDGASEKGNVYGEARVKEVFFAIEIDEFYQLIFG